jgi:hypothetical protein
MQLARIPPALRVAGASLDASVGVGRRKLAISDLSRFTAFDREDEKTRTSPEPQQASTTVLVVLPEQPTLALPVTVLDYIAHWR